jgi:hypothetical protein
MTTVNEVSSDPRSVQRGLLVAAALFAIPAVVVGTFAWAQYLSWAPLDTRGVRTPAEVVGMSRYKLSDRRRVAFPTVRRTAA